MYICISTGEQRSEGDNSLLDACLQVGRSNLQGELELCFDTPNCLYQTIKYASAQNKRGAVGKNGQNLLS
jgi:hypothetical protein